MKYQDALAITDESSDFLEKADDCTNLTQRRLNENRVVSKMILSNEGKYKKNILVYLATSSFVSLSTTLKECLAADQRLLKKFFDSVTDSDLNTPEGRVIKKKLSYFYALKTISSTFDDHNLLELKKAFSNHD